jgi:hypothetical protein
MTTAVRIASAAPALALGLAIGLLTSCGAPAGASAAAGRESAGTGGGGGRFEPQCGRLEAEINRYRRSIGRAPVPRDPGLDRMARQHCEFMARNPGKFTLGSTIITHYGFEERALQAQRQHGMLSLAENVAGGPDSPAMAGRFVRAWAASAGHDFNLRQDWDATGIGVFITPTGTAYATQLFATRSRSHFQTTDRMRGF